MAHFSKTRLKLSCLPSNINDDHFQSLFASVGQLVECRIIRDENTGFCVGTGFVEYETEYEAEDAIKMLNGKVVYNKCIKVTHLLMMDDGAPSARLRIDNLPTWCTFSMLGLKFSDFGEVLGCRTEIDPQTGLPNGVGFVEFGTKEEAIRAKNCLSGTVLEGASLPLAVRFVESQYDTEHNADDNYAVGNNVGGFMRDGYDGSCYPWESCGDESRSGCYGPSAFADGQGFQGPRFQGPQMYQVPGPQMNFEGSRWQECFQAPGPPGFQGPRLQKAPGEFPGPQPSMAPGDFQGPRPPMAPGDIQGPQPQMAPGDFRGPHPLLARGDFQGPRPLMTPSDFQGPRPLMASGAIHGPQPQSSLCHFQGPRPQMTTDFQGPRPVMATGDIQRSRPQMGQDNFQGPRPWMIPSDFQGPQPQMAPCNFQGPRPPMAPGDFQEPRPQMAPGDFQGPRPQMAPGDFQGPRPQMIPSDFRGPRPPSTVLGDFQSPGSFSVPNDDFQRPVPPLRCRSSQPPIPPNNGHNPGQMPQMRQGHISSIHPTNHQGSRQRLFQNEGYSSQIPNGPWMQNNGGDNNIVQEFNETGSCITQENEFKGPSYIGPVRSCMSNNRYNPVGSNRNS